MKREKMEGKDQKKLERQKQGVIKESEKRSWEKWRGKLGGRKGEKRTRGE